MVKTQRPALADCLGTEHASERFQLVLNSIADGVFAVDREWRLTCFNRAAAESIGIPREKALGRLCHEVLKANVCKGACPLRYTMETGTPVVNLAVTLRDAQGRPIPAAISTAVLRDGEGRIMGGVETFRDLNKVQALLHQMEALDPLTTIVTTDPSLKRTLELLPTIAASDSSVLIEGESGTGKGLAARAIHLLSSRKGGPFVTVNCGALPETLFESELFGYKAGAFTGATKDKPGRVALADRGTLFLDEIGDMPLSVQVKMLRLLHEKVYEPLGGTTTLTADVRIVAATNRDLARLVAEGTFREDLFYRINVIRITMPPLRARPADAALIAERFVRRTAAKKGKRIDGLSPEAVALLMRYDFPGNVRELENILEYACLFCSGPLIEVRDLPEWFRERLSSAEHPSSSFEEAEAKILQETLARCGWSRTRAAAALGIHKTTLHRKIRRLRLDLPREDGRSKRSQ